jgi:hypothetical protein
LKNFIRAFHNFIGDFLILLAILDFYWRKSPVYWRKLNFIGELEIPGVFFQLKIRHPRTSLKTIKKDPQPEVESLPKRRN